MAAMGDRLAPDRIAVAGDWHGNTGWALHVIDTAATVVDGKYPFILHLGDFGIGRDRHGIRYLDAVSDALRHHGIHLAFVDGNHEDHGALARCAAASVVPPHRVADRVHWFPRGYRWNWHGRAWLACGGGVSLDRVARTEGHDWWPQEEITSEQEAAIIAGGQADVLVAHDCPAGVVHSYPAPPSWWDKADLARSGAHQARLQRIVGAVKPGHIVHGHLHMAYQRRCDFGYGPVEVTGLDCDGGAGPNWAVLDIRSMTWKLP